MMNCLAFAMRHLRYASKKLGKRLASDECLRWTEEHRQRRQFLNLSYTELPTVDLTERLNHEKWSPPFYGRRQAPPRPITQFARAVAYFKRTNPFVTHCATIKYCTQCSELPTCEVTERKPPQSTENMLFDDCTLWCSVQTNAG